MDGGWEIIYIGRLKVQLYFASSDAFHLILFAYMFDVFTSLRYDRSTNTESGDYCSYNFGSDGVVYFASPHHYWPQSNVQIGNRNYLLQLTFNPVTGGCAKAVATSVAMTTSTSRAVQRRQQGEICPAGSQMKNNTCVAVS